MRHALAQSHRRAFTLIELLVVIGVIVLLAAMTVPAIKSLTKNNDQSQATNQVRAMIDTARSIAISQHRQAGVVFFEETPKYALPVNSNQTAMQLFVEDYNQQNLTANAPITIYSQFSARQYLPSGVKLAVLTDAIATGNLETGDIPVPSSTVLRARAIVFDANGQLITRGGLATSFAAGNAGSYPYAYGDWNFFRADGRHNDGSAPVMVNWGDASSFPGFFLYNKSEYDAQPQTSRPSWIKQHADVVIVNANTGTVLQ